MLEFREIVGLLVAGGSFPCAGAIWEMYQEIRKGKELPEVVAADPVPWSNCARNTRRCVLSAAAFAADCEFDWAKEGHRSIASEMRAGVSALGRLTPQQRSEMTDKPVRQWPRKIRRYVRLVQVLYKGFVRARSEPSHGKVEEIGPDVDFLNRLGSASERERLAVFASVRSVLLCLVVAGKTPSQLLRRVRQKNDLVALDQLLRIDRRLYMDRGIQKRVRAEISNPKSPFMRVALSALKGKPPAMKEKTLKARLAALVQLIGMDSTLFQEPGLRAMYDHLAMVQSAGTHLRDESLPLAPEAQQKAISRERQRFIKLFNEAAGQK